MKEHLVYWYAQNGEEDAVVVSSRIRFARNLDRIPFPHLASEEQKKQLLEQVMQAIKKMETLGIVLNYIPMETLDDANALRLVEHHLVSPEFIRTGGKKGLFVSKDESISIMVGEEDHLRIQVIQSGLALSEAAKKAKEIDEFLDSELSFAFDEQLGYLTACPSNLGTGMRASVMMHLYALEQMNLMPRLASTISKLGLTVRGTFGEGSKAKSHYYQISNQVSLGIEEDQAIENLRTIAVQLIAQEDAAQQKLVTDRDALEDQAYRTLGELKFARRISFDELCQKISLLRLAICQKVIEIQPRLLNTLFLTTGAASVTSMAEKECTPKERDGIRAKLVQEQLED